MYARHGSQEPAPTRLSPRRLHQEAESASSLSTVGTHHSALSCSLARSLAPSLTHSCIHRPPLNDGRSERTSSYLGSLSFPGELSEVRRSADRTESPDRRETTLPCRTHNHAGQTGARLLLFRHFSCSSPLRGLASDYLDGSYCCDSSSFPHMEPQRMAVTHPPVCRERNFLASVSFKKAHNLTLNALVPTMQTLSRILD